MFTSTFHIERDRELRLRVPDTEVPADSAMGTGSSIRLVDDEEDGAKRTNTGKGRGGKGGGRGGRGGGTKTVVEVCGALLQPNVRHFLCPGTTVVIRAWTPALIEVEGSAQLTNDGYDNGGTNGLHARPVLEYHNLLHTARRHAYNMFIAGGGAATINPKSVATALGAVGTEGDSHAKDGGVVENGSERLARMDRYGVGPRVLIIGKTCTGRHTFARTLGNYASRLGYCPTVVDLCPSASQCIGLPGSIGAAVQESPLTPDTGFTYDNYPSICYPVGVIEPQSPDALSYDAGGRSIYGSFSAAALELCSAVSRRLSISAVGSMGSHSGCVVCAPPLRGKDGSDFIVKLIETLAVTHVLCIGDVGMYASLSKACSVLAPFMDNNSHEPTTTEEGASFVAKHRPQLILPSGFRFQLDYLSTSPAIIHRSPVVRRAFGMSRCKLYLGGGRFQVTSFRHVRRHEVASVFQLSVTYYHRSGSAATRVGAEVLPSVPGAQAMLAAYPHIVSHAPGPSDQPPPAGNGSVSTALPYFLSQWAALSPTIPNPVLEDGTRARPYVSPMAWSVNGPARPTLMPLADIKSSIGSIVAVMDASPNSDASGRQATSFSNLETRPIAVFGKLVSVDVEEVGFVVPVPESALAEFPHVALVVMKFHMS